MASKHDRTEAPTPKRKRESRKKGQIARSADLVSWAQVLVFSMMAGSTVSRCSAVLTGLFDRLGTVADDPQPARAVALLGPAMAKALLALAPALAALVLVSLVANLAQTGLLVSGAGLKPKPDRLNPMKGVKRLVSPISIWEAGKVIVRAGVLAVVAVPAISRVAKELLLMGNPGVGTSLGTVATACLAVIKNVAMAGLLLAAVDYLLQRRRLLRSIRMTKQEVKDEARQSEGDPHVRAQIRSRQLSISRNRMMAEVSSATAVIVNPTHVAVAIRYEASSGAPVVVAKGHGAIALRIREEAGRHGVPIFQDIPLARALHAACELGQEIPLELYEAVARVLALLMTGSAVR